MISRLKGILLARAEDRIEIETSGGVVYEVEIPATVMERLPQAGRAVEVRTVQVVREDSITLYGFLSISERTLFVRLLSAPGIGPRLALSMMSTLSAGQLARALAEKNLALLTRIPGVGKKTAERISFDLADRVADLAEGEAEGGAESSVVEGALSALIALGVPHPEADLAIRGVLADADSPPDSTERLVRLALARRS